MWKSDIYKDCKMKYVMRERIVFVFLFFGGVTVQEMVVWLVLWTKLGITLVTSLLCFSSLLV